MTERAFPWRNILAGEPRRYRTLTDRAYEEIRARIVNGTFTPSVAVTEADLATELAMSKTPVREALLRLQAEDFVQAIPRRGYVVAPLKLSQIKDLFAFRSLIEGETAALASRLASPALLEEMAALIRSDDPSPHDEPERISRMILVNNAFHETISLASDNRRLHRSVVQIIREFERFYFVEASSPDFFDPTFVNHRAILDAIRTGDPETARRTMGEHIESSRRVLVRAITESTGPGRIGEIWY